MKTVEQIEEILKQSQLSESIGTKQEKYIHQFIKYLICDDSACHEVKIGRHIVDVKIDNHIYEIQTTAFAKLQNKVSSLLNDFDVTIVYPVLVEKILYKEKSDGTVVGPRKSPKPDTVYKLFSELYQIQELLDHPKLSFKLILLSVNYYQKERLNRYHQIRYSRIDSRVNQILDIIDINRKNELSKLFTINDEFDRKIFEKASKLSGRKASAALVTLKNLGIINVIRLEGKKYIYHEN